MKLFVIVIAIFVAITDWVAVIKNWQKVENVTKPAVMIILMIWIVLLGGLQVSQTIIFLVGAGFSLLGDIALLSENKGFLVGLISFLMAHLAYIVALNNPLVVLNIQTLILAGFIFVVLFFARNIILKGVRRQGKTELGWPISIYVFAIGTMLFSAINTMFNTSWLFLPALFVGAGAIFFAMSDFCLAWNLFVAPFKFGKLIVMVTYHLGQTAILFGATYQYLK